MEFITYIAKSAGILTLFYVVYLLVLQKDTFYSANRVYLLIGIFSALVLPFVTFTSITFVAAPLVEASQGITEFTPLAATQLVSENPLGFWELIFYGYLLGIALMLVRFIIQLYSLLRLLQKHPAKTVDGFYFVEIDHAVAPFSFFNYIVYNSNTHTADELKLILKHEKVHATQWHSIDLLLANFIRTLQWANPISWLYKSRIATNLEYLADSRTAQQLPSKTEYQLALLKASSSVSVPALANNFYQSFTHLNVFGKEIKLDFESGQVKKRIIMLNKCSSNKYQQLKLILVLPALALFLWGFNTEEVIEYTAPLAENSINGLTKVAPSKSKSFSEAATDLESIELERFFKVEHPSSLVKIANQDRNVTQPMLGKNPLYIINGKQFRKNTLPEGYTFELDGMVEALNPKQGITKYGNKGKDGVLFFNGVTTFVPVKPTSSDREKAEQTFNHVKKTKATETKKISENKKVHSSDKEIRIKITKNTTKEDLERIKTELEQEHGIIFSYKNLNYNANNELTSITILYKGKGMNGNYTVVEDDGKGINDLYFYMDTEKGISSFNSGKMQEREEARTEMMEKREKILDKARVERRENLEQRRNEMAKVREKMREERNDMRKRMEKMRQEHEAIEEEDRARVPGYASTTTSKVNGRGTKVIIGKDTTDDELANIKSELEAKGISFSYSRLKRNANGEITRIKIQSDNGMGSKQTISTSSDDGEPIERIIIEQ